MTYNAANQMTRMIWFANGGRDPNGYVYAEAYERREYNTLNQLTRIYAFPTGSAANMDLTYQYTAGSNNGQISGTMDGTTQQTSYVYDALKRLNGATAAVGGATDFRPDTSFTLLS